MCKTMRAGGALLLSALLLAACGAKNPSLESGWKNPPNEARPHAYWLWLNGFVDREAARAELEAMKKSGFSGVLLFDMGARGAKDAQPPGKCAPSRRRYREPGPRLRHPS